MVRDADVKKKDGGGESVKVVVRCRPMNEKETKEQHQRVVDMDVARGVVEIRNIKASEADPPKTFTYDAVYDWNSKQMDLYDETFRPLVDSVLNGFNGTIFAYGQTGTGKTFTMEGIRDDPDLRGVIPNSFEHIFNHIARSTNQQYLIRASYLEIYQEEITDLLGKDQKKKLELKERPDTGVYVKDLQQFVCKSVNEIQHVMTVGNQNRSVGATNMNLHSSRSHAIFIITIENCETREDGKGLIRVGKLNLVDLAGSERQSKTGAMGERLKEATKINLSLSALGNVISALVDGKSSHIPYRDSKLTRILQDSLGGNSKTIMVANIGPASYNYDETITTLRYANRAKNIKNKPKVNEDPKDAILREYQQEIARLKSQLMSKSGKKEKKKKKEKEHQEDGEEEEEEEGIDPDFIVQQEKELEEDRNRIQNNKEMIEEEKEQFLQEVKKKEAEVEASKKAQESLMGRIKTMESKLLSGGKNIIDHTNEQQQAIEQRSHELLEQKQLEREMLQKLEKEEETSYEVEQTYNSLQQEVEAKTRKLKKLFAKLQGVKTEMTDMHEEFCRDRVDLQQTQDVLTRELKLKALIIENFISPEEKRKILSRAFFDEDEDIWKIRPVVKQSGSNGTLKRPVSSASRRPTSEYARMQASLDHNPRFKGENIMIVELDGAVRTTREWEGPTVAPRVSAALEAALTPMDDDLSIDASTILSHSHAVKSQRKDRTTKGKFRPSCDKDDIEAVIKICKQTMNSIIPEVQEWYSPPLPSAGQLSALPQVSWTGTKVAIPGTHMNDPFGTLMCGTQMCLPRSWSPDSFRAPHHDNDDYYEDPSDFLMLSSIALDDSRNFTEKERIFCNLRFDFREIHSGHCREYPDSEKDRDSTEDLCSTQDELLEPQMLQDYVLDNNIDGFWENYEFNDIEFKDGKELIFAETKDLNKIHQTELNESLDNKKINNIAHEIISNSLTEYEDNYNENIINKSEESFYNNPNVIVGPFGVCRTCYHYKPQVKRCATKALFRKPNKLLIGSCYNLKKDKTDSFLHSSSSLSSKTSKDCPNIRKNYFHKMDKRKLQKNHWRRFWGNVPCRFSSLVHKKKGFWNSSLRPFKYERIFWRLPCPIWRQIVNLLTNKDDINIASLNPVMFSMKQISRTLSARSSQMVSSLSQDSYGDTDMLRADLSLAVCIGCLVVFLHRVLRGASLLLLDLAGCCNVDAEQQIMWLTGEAAGLIIAGIYYTMFLRPKKSNMNFCFDEEK